MWSELVGRLKTPVRGKETLTEYIGYRKSQQDDLKDVGGFVAGTLLGNRRKATAVTGRDVLTLDVDSIPAGGTQDVLRRIDGLGCGFAVYSTRKHHEAAPRLRVLLPLDRTVSADEYEPVARKIASLIGMELCDPTTFEASRLMYWPSCSADSQYIYVYGDKPFLSADGVLAMYGDWHDISQWPQVPGTQDVYIRLAKKQGDPTEKQGVVGALCRTYDIYRALEELIPGEYDACDTAPDRYTYIGGSTTGGAVIYDDGKFLYSHHATDPCSGKLVNSFDLVRLHKFGDQDDKADPGTPTNRLPSYTLMCKFAVENAGVAAVLNQERYEKAVEVFTDATAAEAGEVDNLAWIETLEVSSTTGQPAKMVDNVLIILENDPLLKGKMAFDEFANRGLALGALPWDTRDKRRQWVDIDDAGLRNYIEKVYHISGKDRVYDATALCAFKRRINDVQEYLTALSWDGTKRLDTLLTDYLGASDNPYVRAVIRKSLAAAIARAMTPGVKYDYMPILAGPQGIGKSTFLRLLGRGWYSDSLATFEGKEASEMIQGTWINELGELNGFTKTETNSIKQFLSRTDDIFREPYGRRTSSYPRRCVFFGSTNDVEFLRDHTGNRRFWPVDVGLTKPAKCVFTELVNEVDQIWAEAFVAWQFGETLYLTGEAETISKDEQDSHKIRDAKEGIIGDFLKKRLPLDWDKRDLQQRRMHWSGGFRQAEVETRERDKVCAAEIWCECFGKEISFMKQTDTREINNIIDSLGGWRRHKSTQRFAEYGTQRGFEKL